MLDTTSHNVAWEVLTLGDASSVLSDVAIINDTLAYAVGEIFLRDSSSNWSTNPYNLLKWNGTAWTPIRIFFYTACGQPGRTPYPASSVYAFGGDDVWIAMDGSQIARWNGITQTATMCSPVSFSIRQLWGESPQSVYAVGDLGKIVHYANGTWTSLESGTLLPTWDIWGSNNPGTGKSEILCVASNLSSPPVSSALFRIGGETVTEISSTGLSSDVSSLWFMPDNIYYVVGAGIHHKRSLDESEWQRYPWHEPTTYTSSCVRGSGVNDVFVVGSFGEVVHYNGASWHRYGSEASLPNGAYGKVAMKDDLVIAVGLTQLQAVILMGRYLP